MSCSLGRFGLRPVVAENAGFCYGVQRAFSMALDACEGDGPKYTLGPLIHNAAVVDMLRGRGLQPLPGESALESITEGTVVIRSHGASRGVVEAARARGLNVIDATCPYVQRAHAAADALVSEGYTLIIVGDRGHPEVTGILGTISNRGRVVASAQEIGPVESLRYGVIAQTTQSRETVREVVNALLEGAREVRVVNTICTATRERQDGVRQIATKVDTMLVVGDPSSANTNRLAEISRDCGVQTYLIESAEEMKTEWFKQDEAVGVTAGASTPSWIIEEVLRRMHDSIDETPNAPETEEGHASMPDAAEFSKSLEPIRVGDIVQATVVSVTQDEAMVDIGFKSEGTIPLKELSHRRVSAASELVAVGDVFPAKIIDISNDDDSVTLSRKQADEERSWESLEQSYREGTRVRGIVTAQVKGGLTIDLGVRGFLPVSQVERGFTADLEPYIGRELEVIVTELDEERPSVVVSRRRVLDEDFAKLKAQVYGDLRVGLAVEGVVKRLADFGAFVELESGVEGLLHVSEISWSRVNHPSEVLKEGERITVIVLGVDAERERISLGLKQTLESPWSKAAEKYQVGSIVKGVIGSVAAFGAFVRLEDGIEGLIHISQLSHTRVTNPAQVVRPGQEVTAKVVSFDAGAKRIGLSIKELTSADAPETGSAEGGSNLKSYSTDGGAPGPTLGDLMGHALKGSSKDSSKRSPKGRK